MLAPQQPRGVTGEPCILGGAVNVLNYIFRASTSSFYTTETWHRFRYISIFKEFAVVYHKCFLKIAAHNIWDSNHETCEKVNVSIFKGVNPTTLVKITIYFFFRKKSSQNIIRLAQLETPKQ